MKLPAGMSAAQHFSRSPQATIPRSSFNRSHGHKTTFNAGDLIPVYLDEALPGDTFNCKMTAFSRLATPLFPIMDNLYLESFFFAVPYRLVWNHWENFNGANIPNPASSTDYILPQMTAPVGGFTEGSLFDYFGYPTKVTGVLIQNTLFARAYNLIFNEWFRDENLQNSAVVDLGDGPDTPSNYVIRKRGKRYDYFTSCLPWPQKGPSVQLPLGTTAPVWGNTEQAIILRNTASGNKGGMFNTTTSGLVPGSVTGAFTNNTGVNVVRPGDGYSTSGLYADLSTATAATINQLRQAFQIQKLYERDARGGTRYTEIIKAHFGVISPDARLQRPEYLGGGHTAININPVAQTSGTGISDQDTPQGNLAAFGTAAAINHGFVKSFTEHCLIIGLVSVRSDYTYQQGLNRMYSRSTRWDMYWPALSHIGEQAVLNKEIYAQGTSADDNVFGYQERYAEYRYKPSQVSGLFRSNATGTLDSWHLAQDFGSLPTLSDTFIQENPPMARIKAVTSEPDFLFDSYFDLKCARPMPVYSVPGLIDHF